jgi:rhodanese-related sulfurtransferase
MILNKISESINFDQLKDSLKSNLILFIDVRNRREITSQGKMPNSVNIPMSELLLDGTFQLSNADFKEQYGFEKPLKGVNIVVLGYSGIRASKAAKHLKKLGYSQIKVYHGSFSDWVDRGGTWIYPSDLQG